MKVSPLAAEQEFSAKVTRFFFESIGIYENFHELPKISNYFLVDVSRAITF